MLSYPRIGERPAATIDYWSAEVRRHLRLSLFARTSHERASSILMAQKAARIAWRAARLAGV